MNNLDLPNIVKAAVPEGENRNVRVLSHNETSHRDSNFLSSDFPRSPPKLYVTAEADEFDQLTLAEWRDEGFHVEYFSMESCGSSYWDKLRSLSRQDLALGDKFGIIAFGDAAAACLEYYHILENNPEFKLGLLVAYYPSAIPDPKGHFPNSISALVHLTAGEEIGVTKQTQMVGIQGKRRTTRKKIQSGVGTGGTLRLAFPSYTYSAEPGFAEHDVEEYHAVSAELAWSRSVGLARKVFGMEAPLESVWEATSQNKFLTPDPDKAVSYYALHKPPHVTNVPTLTGGIVADELKRFYSEVFVHPPSIKVTLLSRTVGADRVVDEMHVKFKHTQEVPWILPGVPATDKRVEVLMVSIVALRGKKLYHEHLYWDQASVLVQVGLLDPKLVPEEAKKIGVERLPVVGRKAARRVLSGWEADEEGPADNELVSGWGSGPEEKPKAQSKQPSKAES